MCCRERFAICACKPVWILTKSGRNLRLPGYDMLTTHPPEHPGYHQFEAYAAIHSRYKLKPVDFTPFDTTFAVCAEIEQTFGRMIVYGSIITYHFDGVAEGAEPWERHRFSARQHAADWKRLRERFSEHILVVGGDFNQALDGVGRYRDGESTSILRDAFSKADLRCVTEENFVECGKLQTRHSIDHIAIATSALSEKTVTVDAWEGTTAEGINLSDHNGVIVTLALPDSIS